MTFSLTNRLCLVVVGTGRNDGVLGLEAVSGNLLGECVGDRMGIWRGGDLAGDLCD